MLPRLQILGPPHAKASFHRGRVRHRGGSEVVEKHVSGAIDPSCLLHQVTGRSMPRGIQDSRRRRGRMYLNLFSSCAFEDGSRRVGLEPPGHTIFRPFYEFPVTLPPVPFPHIFGLLLCSLCSRTSLCSVPRLDDSSQDSVDQEPIIAEPSRPPPFSGLLELELLEGVGAHRVSCCPCRAVFTSGKWT